MCHTRARGGPLNNQHRCRQQGTGRPHPRRLSNKALWDQSRSGAHPCPRHNNSSGNPVSHHPRLRIFCGLLLLLEIQVYLILRSHLCSVCIDNKLGKWPHSQHELLSCQPLFFGIYYSICFLLSSCVSFGLSFLVCFPSLTTLCSNRIPSPLTFFPHHIPHHSNVCRQKGWSKLIVLSILC